jgi:DNA-binding transcriptional MerR regulator
MPLEVREELKEEWQAELAFLLGDTAGLPLTRLLRGAHYGLSLLLASRGLARDLSTDATDMRQDALTTANMPRVPKLVPSSEYSGLTACAVAGITYRQLDYWTRMGLLSPTQQCIHGGDAGHLYSFRDLLLLKVIKRLLDTGISITQIRVAAQRMHMSNPSRLNGMTLMSDGVSLYECLSPDEVVELLQGGQGVFGIAIRQIWREVENTLANLPVGT